MRNLELAVKYLSGNRLYGTNAERLALTTLASAGWTETTGDAVTEIGSGTLDFDYKSGTYNGKGYYDLTTVSDTAWVLRFENINFSTWTTYGAMWLGISSITAQDEANSGSSIMTRLADFGDGDDYLTIQSFNNSTTKVSGSDGRPAITASTNYNLEIIRDGTTITTNLYTTAFTGTPLATSTDTISGTTGLRYLFVQNYYSTGAGNANRNIIGTIDGIKFYNGITSVTSQTPTYETDFTSTYPNLKNGSTFLTSDTNELWMWDGTSAWNEVS